MVEYKPVSKIPLSEVKPIIEGQVVSAEAEKLAKAEGEKKLAELKAGGTAEFGAAKSVSRMNFNGVSGPAVAALMKADTNKLPAYVGVPTPGKGYSIFRINSVNNVVADEEAVKAEKQQVEEFLASQEMAAYLTVVKKRAKAEILKPVAVSKPVAEPGAAK